MGVFKKKTARFGALLYGGDETSVDGLLNGRVKGDDGDEPQVRVVLTTAHTGIVLLSVLATAGVWRAYRDQWAEVMEVANSWL